MTISTLSACILVLAMSAALCLTPIARRMALALGFVDIPTERKLHTSPTPLLGGPAVFIAATVSVLPFLDEILAFERESGFQALGILAGSALLLLTGILDDQSLLHAQVKLVVAMPLAGLLLSWGGVRIQTEPWVSLLTDEVRVHSALSLALTVFWVTAVTAAFSIFDYMDGLCTGVTAVAALFFLVFGVSSGQSLIAGVAAAILGAALGFLLWNFNPARIFLGDGGAMFCGFIMATLSLLLLSSPGAGERRWMLPVALLAVPLFDAVLVTVSRLRRGRNPFATPGKDHAAHRLANWGLGIRGAVLALYSAGLAAGCAAYLMARSTWMVACLLFAGLALVWLAAIIVLEQAPCKEEKQADNRST